MTKRSSCSMLRLHSRKRMVNYTLERSAPVKFFLWSAHDNHGPRWLRALKTPMTAHMRNMKANSAPLQCCDVITIPVPVIGDTSQIKSKDRLAGASAKSNHVCSDQAKD